MKLSGVLIFLSLISATLHEGSPELTSFEIITASILVIIFFSGVCRLLVCHDDIPRPLFYLLVFFAWSVINIIIAIANGVNLLWWLRRFFPFFALFSATLGSFYSFQSYKQIRVAFLTLIVIGVIIVLLSISQIRTIDLKELANLQELRKYGSGYFSAFGLCLSVPFVFYHQKLKTLAWSLAVLVSIIFTLALALSFTRTYWISTCVALLFTVYFTARIRRIAFPIILIKFIAPLFLVLLSFLWIAPENICEFLIYRITSIFQAVNDTSFLDRIFELKGLWSSSLKNPITIFGGNGFGAKFIFYSVDPFSWGRVGWIKNDYSHNFYAYLLWTTGIIGLSLFIFFGVSMLIQIAKTLRNPSLVSYYLIGIFSAIMNLSIASLAAPPLMSFEWAVYFGILVGIAINLINLQCASNKLLQ